MEIWEDINGYEGYYQVSNLGRVKRLRGKRRYGWGYRTVKERMVKVSKGAIFNIKKRDSWKHI